MDKPLELVAAYSATIGKRPFMEDYAVMLPEWDEQKAFFAVYDGHGGKCAAEFSSQKLHENLKELIKQNPHEERDKLLVNAFTMTDEQLVKKEIKECGTTALVAVLENDHLHIAWAGDSRAVVIRNNQILCQTIDHTFNTAVEKLRAEINGFSISSYRLQGKTISRISPDGFIPSRALGNHEYSCKQKKAMIGNPDVISISVQPNDLVVMGSDGLFDDLTLEQISEQVKAWHEKKLVVVDQETLESTKMKGIGNARVRELTDKLSLCAIQACPAGVCCDNITTLAVSIKEKAKAASVAPENAL